MLATRDFIFAFALHIIVVGLLLLTNEWHEERVKFPERVMQVNMVSLNELQAMMKQPEPKKVKPQPVKKVVTQPKNPESKPVKKEDSKAKPRPKADKKPAIPQPVIAPTPPSQPKKKKVVEEELDYDPFAPMESAPKERVKRKTHNAQALQDILQAQMTDVEINRYIARMQQAVERQWKVPTESASQLHKPLVELKLSPRGDVVRVRILESSGSKTLDETLLQAIYAAAPFDIPSQQYDLFKTNRIRFHPL
ncbi:MAG: TonB family protein [Ghiorsea sp.]|nr:TonB family protein [Ghiorsea sp.]